MQVYYRKTLNSRTSFFIKLIFSYFSRLEFYGEKIFKLSINEANI